MIYRVLNLTQTKISCSFVLENQTKKNKLKDRNMTKILHIRNSTTEFLVFTRQTGDNSIEVRYEDETIWLSQRMMAG